MATKDDMDRIGLFKEMEYVTIKDPYKEPARCKFSCHFFCVSNHFFVEVSFNEAANKNKQMMSKCSKERSTGSMAGYFDNEFKILSGSYIDPISMRRQARLEEKKKNIVTKPFVSMYRPRDPYVKDT
jgi:hypothetical protein